MARAHNGTVPRTIAVIVTYLLVNTPNISRVNTMDIAAHIAMTSQRLNRLGSKVMLEGYPRDISPWHKPASDVNEGF